MNNVIASIHPAAMVEKALKLTASNIGRGKGMDIY